MKDEQTDELSTSMMKGDDDGIGGSLLRSAGRDVLRHVSGGNVVQPWLRAGSGGGSWSEQVLHGVRHGGGSLAEARGHRLRRGRGRVLSDVRGGRGCSALVLGGRKGSLHRPYGSSNCVHGVAHLTLRRVDARGRVLRGSIQVSR
jgi:hypothetical protein